MHGVSQHLSWLGLAGFTWHNVLKVHPCRSLWQNCFLLKKKTSPKGMFSLIGGGGGERKTSISVSCLRRGLNLRPSGVWNETPTTEPPAGAGTSPPSRLHHIPRLGQTTLWSSVHPPMDTWLFPPLGSCEQSGYWTGLSGHAVIPCSTSGETKHRSCYNRF